MSTGEVDRPAPEEQEIDYGLLPSLIGYQLRRAHVRVYSTYLASRRDEGVTPPLFGLLTLIARNGGRSQKSIAKAIGIDGSTLVAMLDRLEEKGLVERRRSEKDRRVHGLYATPAGRAELQRLEDDVANSEKAIASDLSADERQTLIDLLKKLGRR